MNRTLFFLHRTVYMEIRYTEHTLQGFSSQNNRLSTRTRDAFRQNPCPHTPDKPNYLECKSADKGHNRYRNNLWLNTVYSWYYKERFKITKLSEGH